MSRGPTPDRSPSPSSRQDRSRSISSPITDRLPGGPGAHQKLRGLRHRSRHPPRAIGEQCEPPQHLAEQQIKQSQGQAAIIAARGSLRRTRSSAPTVDFLALTGSASRRFFRCPPTVATGRTCLSAWPPRGRGAAAPGGALRAIGPCGVAAFWRTCGPRCLRRHSKPELATTQRGMQSICSGPASDSRK